MQGPVFEVFDDESAMRYMIHQHPFLRLYVSKESMLQDGGSRFPHASILLTQPGSSFNTLKILWLTARIENFSHFSREVSLRN